MFSRASFSPFAVSKLPKVHREALLNRAPDVKPYKCGGKLGVTHQLGRLVVLRCSDCGDCLYCNSVSLQVLGVSRMNCRPTYFLVAGDQAVEAVRQARIKLDEALGGDGLDQAAADLVERAHEILTRLTHGRVSV